MDQRGSWDRACAPSRSNFFHFHAVFGRKRSNNRLALQTLEFNCWHPPPGNPRSPIALSYIPNSLKYPSFLDSNLSTQISPNISLADLGGGVRDARPPLGVQILSISCSFRENLACSRPPLEGSRPPLGKILDPPLYLSFTVNTQVRAVITLTSAPFFKPEPFYFLSIINRSLFGASVADSSHSRTWDCYWPFKVCSPGW